MTNASPDHWPLIGAYTASVPLRWRGTRLEFAAPVVCGHMAEHFSTSHAVVEEAAIGAALGTASGRLSESRLCLREFAAGASGSSGSTTQEWPHYTCHIPTPRFAPRELRKYRNKHLLLA